MIDYAWAAAAESLPKMMNGAVETARLVRGAGAAAGVNSMITNYEAGVVRVMPMKGHLAVDFVMCTALMLSPLFLPASERRYAFVPMALGAIGMLASLMTQTESPIEHSEGFMPSHQLSEAVADPDVARTPHLRTHLE
jgi:hypothetical protein